MPSFVEIAQQVITNQTITPEQEEQLNSLFWSKDFDETEMYLLQRLIETIAQKGQV